MRMHLRILLPHQVFAEHADVSRIVVDTLAGSHGLLPQRLDCVAALTPGILVYESDAHGEAMIAIDEGVMIKAGTLVLVSVRRAVLGDDLQHLQKLVAKEFLEIDQLEREARSTMARLEVGFLHRFAALHHDR